MISIKIFEDYDKNLSEVLNKIIKKNKIELFQSEEWLKTNLDIYNCNNDTKVYFVVCFKESEPCIFLPLTVKLLNGVRILTWLDSPANDYCGAIISNDIKNNGQNLYDIWYELKHKLNFDAVFLEKIHEDIIEQIRNIIPIKPHIYQTTYTLNLKKNDFENFYFSKNSSKSRETDRRKEKKLNSLNMNFTIKKNNIESLESHLSKKEDFYKLKKIKTFDSQKLFRFYMNIFEKNKKDEYEFFFSKLENDKVLLSSVFGIKFDEKFYYLVPLVEKSNFLNLSPGKFNLIYLIKSLSESENCNIDFGPGDESYKIDWSNKERNIYYLIKPYTFKGFLYYLYKKNYFRFRRIKFLKFLKNKFL